MIKGSHDHSIQIFKVCHSDKTLEEPTEKLEIVVFISLIPNVVTKMYTPGGQGLLIFLFIAESPVLRNMSGPYKYLLNELELQRQY